MISRRLLLAAPLPPFAPAARAAAKPYRLRLIGGAMEDGAWIAGIAIDLDPDWKTYWRMPGDAGIPPNFDFARSVGAGSVEVLWPAPSRFNDVAGETVGYKHRVVFPVRATAETAPTLILDAFFAVCREVCIPAQAKAELAPPGGALAELTLIRRFAATVPEAGTPFAAARVEDTGGKPQLVLDPARDLGGGADIFVETEGLAYFRAPRFDGARYRLPVDGVADAAALGGKTLRLTVTSMRGNLEQRLAVA